VKTEESVVVACNFQVVAKNGNQLLGPSGHQKCCRVILNCGVAAPLPISELEVVGLLARIKGKTPLITTSPTSMHTSYFALIKLSIIANVLTFVFSGSLPLSICW